MRLQESGQLTDRINKAVERLGNSSLTVNLGGIHQLDRIAADYDDERYPMLRVLTSFLETKAALPAPLQTTSCNPFKIRALDALPAPASQAVIQVLADQVPKLNGEQRPLEIDHADLR